MFWSCVSLLELLYMGFFNRMVSRTLEEDNDISFEEIDSYDKYSDDEDSNAEDFYQNSYPDEDEWPNSDIEKQEI